MTNTSEGISNIMAGLESEYNAFVKGVESETIRIVDGAYIKARATHMGIDLRVLFSMGTIVEHGDNCQSYDARESQYWHINIEHINKTLIDQWHILRNKDLDINIGFMLIIIFQNYYEEELDVDS